MSEEEVVVLQLPWTKAIWGFKIKKSPPWTEPRTLFNSSLQTVDHCMPQIVSLVQLELMFHQEGFHCYCKLAPMLVPPCCVCQEILKQNLLRQQNAEAVESLRAVQSAATMEAWPMNSKLHCGRIWNGLMSRSSARSGKPCSLLQTCFFKESTISSSTSWPSIPSVVGHLTNNTSVKHNLLVLI